MGEFVEFDGSAIPEIRSLIAHYPFHPHRHYPLLTRDHSLRYYERALSSKPLSAGILLFGREHGEVNGVIRIERFAWDSMHFGREMGGITHIIMREEMDRAAKREFLEEAVRRSAHRGIVHLTCRVDAEDVDVIHLLEGMRFSLMDTLTTYVCNKHARFTGGRRCLYRCDSATSEDLPFLTSLARTSFRRDRFHLDPRFSKECADTVFVEWVKRFLEPDRPQRLIVARNTKGCPIGFLGYVLDEEMRSVSGVKIIGRGLSAVSPRAKGAYISLVEATIADVMEKYDLAEFDVRITDRQVTRILNRYQFKVLQIKHTFHLWL